MRTAHRHVIRLAALAIAFVLLASSPVLAQEVVDAHIVGFGEQDCFQGTDNLSQGTATPFDVEACVTNGGSPVADMTLVADIAHGDGSTEAITTSTDDQGVARFRIFPVAAGTTTVRICLGGLDGRCDWGDLTMTATEPPPPPAVASYLGPGGPDIGVTDVITDPQGDFFDPYEGADAEAGLGVDAMDLRSIRYLGNMDGTGDAMFEAITFGDACALADDPTYPWWQFGFAVSTPDDQRYTVIYRLSQGSEYHEAYSDGVGLDSTVSLYECTGDTVVLAGSNLHVPPGSTLGAIAWHSDDPLESGYQDFIDGGVLVAASGDEDGTSGDDDGAAVDEGSTDTDGTPAIVDDASGGDDDLTEEESQAMTWLLWLFLLLLPLMGGAYWFFSQHRSTTSPSADPSTATPPPHDPSELTEEDLAAYATYGIDDHATAREAEALAAEKEADIAKADAHAATVAAEIEEAGEVELEPMPTKPDIANAQLTDSPLLGAVWEFFSVIEEETITGRGRDRVAEVLVAIPDAAEEVGASTLDSFAIAWNGWGEIAGNAELLGTLDESIVYAWDQFVDFTEIYADAALADDDTFVQLQATLIVSAELGAITDRGMSLGRLALVNRLSRTPDVPSAPTTRTPDASVPEPPPTTRTRPTPPPPLADPPAAPPPTRPTPPDPVPDDIPVGPVYSHPRPIGYGSEIQFGAPQRGKGTPKQVAQNGCGPAVARGIFEDFGLEVPSEAKIITVAARMVEDWIDPATGLPARVWKPRSGTTAPGMVQILDEMLPDSFRVVHEGLHALPDKEAAILGWMLDNPTGEVMVGLRWRGAGAGGSGHWVRVESIRDGFVIVGDPTYAKGVSVAIPSNTFQWLADYAVLVTP